MGMCITSQDPYDSASGAKDPANSNVRSCPAQNGTPRRGDSFGRDSYAAILKKGRPVSSPCINAGVCTGRGLVTDDLRNYPTLYRR